MPNSRIHLTRWAITALADEHRKQDHRSGLPGPRRPQPAGDANVRHSSRRPTGGLQEELWSTVVC
jgi:hypothetical protein